MMEAADLVQLESDELLAKRLYLAASTIMFYDALLTLPEQITYLWQPKKTFVSYLSLFNFLFACAFAIGLNIVWFHTKNTPQICLTSVALRSIQFRVVSTVAQVFMTLRIYALSGKNRIIFVTMVICIATQVVLSISTISHTLQLQLRHFTPIPADGYHSTCTLQILNQGLDEVYIYLLLTFDAGVFLATLGYTVKAMKSSRRSHLLRAITLDGSVYFFMMFSTNLTWTLCDMYGREGVRTLALVPSLFITPMMLNRLTLSLHKAHGMDQISISTLPPSTVLSTLELDYEMNTGL